jgi:hypothetical protein
LGAFAPSPVRKPANPAKPIGKPSGGIVDPF